jgi:hypothetical protein
MQIMKKQEERPVNAGDLFFIWCISYGHTASKFARSFFIGRRDWIGKIGDRSKSRTHVVQTR